MELFSFLKFGKPKKANRRCHHNSAASARLRVSKRPEVERLEDRTLPSGNTISGHVYHDVNKNGSFDAGDIAIANNPLELRNAQGIVVDTAITDANGFYQFDNDNTVSTDVTTIEQTVTIEPTLAGFSIARLVDQFDPSLGQLLEVEIINQGAITSDIRAENSSTLVGATINGVVSGKITLTGPGFTLESVVSENAGSFQASEFDGTVDFAGASGKHFDAKTAVADPKSVTLTGAEMNPFIGNGQLQLTENVVVNSTASGGGNVLIGINSEATATFTVRYKYKPSNELQPGEYTIVQLEQPPLNDGTTDRYFDGKEYKNGTEEPNSIGTDEIKVTVGSTNSVNNDFTELPPASLSGFVYQDMNDNGIKDAGEEGIGGVTVKLTGTTIDGQAVAQQTTTNSDGSYSFSDLLEGTYSIEEAQPAGYLDGKDTIGSQGGSTSGDRFTNIALNAGTKGENNNFGELPPSSLSGFVYEDSNDDGMKDPGENGIAGVPIRLVRGSGNNAEVIGTMQTGADGSYQFNNLRPGTYQIIEDQQPSGYADGKDTPGSAGGTAGNDSIQNINLLAGTDGADNNFGERIAADVTVVKTANPNPVLPGGTVTYTLNVSNLGPSTANQVRVEDTLPAEMIFVDVVASGWQFENIGGTLIFTRDSMLSGSSSVIQITATAPTSPGTYSNTAVVSTTTLDINLGNNESTANVTVPKPVISADPPPPPGPNNDVVLSKALILASNDFWFRLLMGM